MLTSGEKKKKKPPKKALLTHQLQQKPTLSVTFKPLEFKGSQLQVRKRSSFDQVIWGTGEDILTHHRKAVALHRLQ